ncbi:MAG TPA: NADH-quinone oxidoreductase subunit M [Acidimicrobiales bacterium]|nr:NADH-quinone oxidoreductase subunit M [Acidimicrobiales bacterium]
MDFPLLTAIVFLPLVGAAIVALLPGARSPLARPLALVVAAAELALVGTMVAEFKTVAGFQFVSQHAWIGAYGISWKVGVDGISLFLVVITAVLFPVAMFGPRATGDQKQFFAWMLLLEAALVGTFLALDLFLFFVLFEITLVPGYFLISGYGGRRRNRAAIKFFLYTFAGSAFLFVAILALVALVAARTGGHESFDLITLARAAGRLPLADQEWIFAGMAAAFAVKMPVAPLHTWMPDAYTEAPTAGSMVLAGLLFKLGTYGILRFGVFLLPHAAIDLAPVLLTLGAVGIIYGAVVAAVQRDLKRLVAYGSLADVGFIVLGLFAFTGQAESGAVVEMVNHGLTTGALFFLVGAVLSRTGTLRISEMGGLQKAAPVLAAVMIAVIMAAVGLPGLNGFVGEFLVLVGTFITHRWWAVVGTTGVVLSAVYLLWAYQRVFQGPARGATETPVGAAAGTVVRDLTWREAAALAPLLAGIVFVGVYPRPLLDRITPSVDHLVAHVQASDPAFAIPAKGRTAHTYAVPADQQVDGPATTAGVQASTGSSASPSAAGAPTP